MTDKQVLHWLSQQHLCSQTSRSREAQFDWWLTSFRLKSRETTQLLIRDAFVPYRCWRIAAGLGATHASSKAKQHPYLHLFRLTKRLKPHHTVTAQVKHRPMLYSHRLFQSSFLMHGLKMRILQGKATQWTPRRGQPHVWHAVGRERRLCVHFVSAAFR